MSSHLYEALAYLKSHNTLFENISILKVLSREEKIRFSDIFEIQEENYSATEKIISDGTEITDNINDTEQKMPQLKIR